VRFAAIDAALRSYPVILPFLSEVPTMATVDDSVSKLRESRPPRQLENVIRSH
jgi:hypothetical protein